MRCEVPTAKYPDGRTGTKGGTAVNAQPDPAPAAPEASETAWRAWLADTGAAHWKTVALKLLRRAFMAGWDSGLQQAAADPQPPGPEGGF